MKKEAAAFQIILQNFKNTCFVERQRMAASVNSFHATGLLEHPDIFREYRKRTGAWNGPRSY